MNYFLIFYLLGILVILTFLFQKSAECTLIIQIEHPSYIYLFEKYKWLIFCFIATFWPIFFIFIIFSKDE